MKAINYHSLLVLFISTNLLSVAQQPIYVGIFSDDFNYKESYQENSNWCWAASLEMIFNYYGIKITQKQIVERSYGSDLYGKLPNWTGSLRVITENLNNWSIDNSGRRYTVHASLHSGAPSPEYLIQELSRQRPILIGYVSGPNSAHAVVITARSYIPTSYGPIIQSVVVRDPWPSLKGIENRGRIEYPEAILTNWILSHWYIRIN